MPAWSGTRSSPPGTPRAGRPISRRFGRSQRKMLARSAPSNRAAASAICTKSGSISLVWFQRLAISRIVSSRTMRRRSAERASAALIAACRAGASKSSLRRASAAAQRRGGFQKQHLSAGPAAGRGDPSLGDTCAAAIEHSASSSVGAGCETLAAARDSAASAPLAPVAAAPCLAIIRQRPASLRYTAPLLAGSRATSVTSICVKNATTSSAVGACQRISAPSAASSGSSRSGARPGPSCTAGIAIGGALAVFQAISTCVANDPSRLLSI